MLVSYKNREKVTQRKRSVPIATVKTWLNENLQSILVERVGSGGYGSVSRVNWPGIPKPVILKENHRGRPICDIDTSREAAILKNLNG